ncbi:nucleoside 2-deoxyribosyltransferase domain-containing protein [Actinoplanes sp. NBRC 101535]|uniref:nucleoside 2-deoxyribosyltransferase domain-containing protein n=1 Tax=Actinoplanes sp. NBRC 101535 TaxID=3032196 RepID=UPI0024A0CB5D|nr:nucleoside 2-deoxyribosyltransferase domain-containing protein [Actinoplanes sp. NBRC 101535]GLY08310.1 hypothetical protein Acsp01_86890 [Actinoplanes sp. NBRC 101535]
MTLNLVWAREPIPAGGPSVFLAGPTPRSAAVPSWRPDAIAALGDTWTGTEPLTVLVPEPRDGRWAVDYHDQVGWEVAGLDAVGAILFWIPRDLQSMPAFTTNVEFGLYVGSGRAVLGCPPDCPSPKGNRYLIWTARRFGVPVYESLDGTVAGALALLDLVTAQGLSGGES